jgi:hypothetical protein
MWFDPVVRQDKDPIIPSGGSVVRNSVLLAIVLLTPFAVGSQAHAAPTQAQQDAIRSSCQSDYRTYCASVPTGGSAALQCLEQNVAKLSSACQSAVKAATGGSSASSGDSGGSSGSGSGSSSTAAPAEGSTSGSAAPADSAGGPVIIVLEPGQAAALMRQACGRDYRAHCNGERILGGAALRCLVSNASSLSGSCKTALGKLGQKF